MIRLLAGCKVNLGLRVTGRRPSGMHELESIFIPLQFPRDEIRITPSPGGQLELSCHPRLEGTAENILVKAWRTYASATGFAPGLKVELLKGIPAGSGLGGGSSDAAAFIAWLNKASNTPLPPDELARIALTLGADVPFFLQAGPCLVRGIGERLLPLPLPAERYYMVIVWPGIHVDTAWAYAEFDRHGMPAAESGKNSLTNVHSEATEIFPHAPGEAAIFALDSHNDLEIQVFAAFPALAALKQEFCGLGARLAGMSGSGSAIYGVFNNSASALAAARTLCMNHGHVFFTPMPDIGV